MSPFSNTSDCYNTFTLITVPVSSASADFSAFRISLPWKISFAFCLLSVVVDLISRIRYCFDVFNDVSSLLVDYGNNFN